MFLKAEIGTTPAVKEENTEQLHFLNCLHSERQKAGSSCYNDMLLPENCCSTSLFITGYKRLAEGGPEAFGFWMMGGFGREKDC
jgi:hypothetical protein